MPLPESNNQTTAFFISTPPFTRFRNKKKKQHEVTSSFCTPSGGKIDVDSQIITHLVSF